VPDGEVGQQAFAVIREAIRAQTGGKKDSSNRTSVVCHAFTCTRAPYRITRVQAHGGGIVTLVSSRNHDRKNS
jgi:hypothetical protein